MPKFFLSRLIQAVPVLIGITIVGFLLIHLVPGDPARVALGPRAPQASVDALRHRYRLDEPLLKQYEQFVVKAGRLDFGRSVVTGEEVRTSLLSRSVTSGELVGYAVILAILVALPAAILSAVRQGKFWDHVVRVSGMALFAMPSFWLGLVLALVLGLQLGLFPTSGYDSSFTGVFRTLTLPALTMAAVLAPMLIRTLRASFIENLNSDYVEAARARGLGERRIRYRHILRNSSLAALSVLGLLVGALLSGSVVVENVFSIPGLGSLLVSAVTERDYPVVQGLIVVFGVAVVVINLATDLAYSAVDPRVRR
jgi:peptide/nickel transport system permease protein